MYIKPLCRQPRAQLSLSKRNMMNYSLIFVFSLNSISQSIKCLIDVVHTYVCGLNSEYEVSISVPRLILFIKIYGVILHITDIRTRLNICIFEDDYTVYITVLWIHRLTAMLLVMEERGNGCCASNYCSTVCTRVEGKWGFCLKLLQHILYQSRGEKAVVSEVTAVLLVPEYRGNDGFAWSYCNTVCTRVEGKWRLCLKILQYW
jgi:hypothetical protein